jgi:hypothetical protein
MENILRKLKLISDFKIELEIEKGEFVEKLKSHVDPSEFGFLSNLSDLFSSSKNDFKGYVGRDYFELKRKRRFFDGNKNLATAKGTYSQNEKKLVLNIQTKGFSKSFIPFLIFVPIIYIIAIVFSIIASVNDQNIPFFVLPFILFHGTLMLGIPYFVMRKSLKNMEKELEKEFFFLTKK